MARRFARCRNLFLTGLVVVVPVIATVAIVRWAFDLLTGYIPGALRAATGHPLADSLLSDPAAAFGIRVLSLAVLILLVTGVGLVAQNVVGRKAIGLVDFMFQRVPMVRTIYSTVQQIGHALLTGGDSGTFRRAVLIEYPRAGVYCLAFVTADGCEEFRKRTGGVDLVSVFVPTTPNPTSGFLLMLPREDLTYLDLSVASAMRLVISGGVFRPNWDQAAEPEPAARS